MTSFDYQSRLLTVSGMGRLNDRQLFNLREFKRKRKLRLLALCGGECVDCGYSANFLALDFDHQDDKEFNIGQSLALSWERLVQEAKKCVIRCANCHRIKTTKSRPLTSGSDRRFFPKRSKMTRSVKL
jgi:hypothetical protein